MDVQNVPPSPDFSKPTNPDKIPGSLAVIRTGDQACEVLLWIMNEMGIVPTADPSADEPFFSSKEIKARINKINKSDLVDLLANIEITILMTHTSPDALKQATKILAAWYLIMTAEGVVSREKYLELLGFI